MKDYSDLKRLAEAAIIGDKPATTPITELQARSAEFRSAASPAAVLELIAENERLSSRLENRSQNAELYRWEIDKKDSQIRGHFGTIDSLADERDQLRSENEALRECVEDLALSLECEVKERYAGTQDHPAITRKFEGDMQEVLDARSLLSRGEIHMSRTECTVTEVLSNAYRKFGYWWVDVEYVGEDISGFANLMFGTK